jgi:hypothetical protein
MRRTNGSQSIPIATGITPTYTPRSAIKPKKPRSFSGVATAASISCSIVPPVEVSRNSS